MHVEGRSHCDEYPPCDTSVRVETPHDVIARVERCGVLRLREMARFANHLTALSMTF